MNEINPTKSTGLFAWFVVLTVAACGHDVKRQNPLDPVLTPPVELTVALNDVAGTATLTWTPYDGDQPFSEYLVLSKVQGLELVDTLDVFDDVGVTSYVDVDLRANTAYLYRVSVINASGFEVTSEEKRVDGYEAKGSSGNK